MLWQQQWGGRGQDFGFDVVSDSQGDVVLTGLFSGSVDFGSSLLTSSGSGDIFTAKVNPAGEVLWAVQLGSPRLDGGNEVATDAADNVLVIANTYGTIETAEQRLEHQGQEDVVVAKYAPSGDLLWLQQIAGPGNERGRGIVADPDGNVFVTGEFAGTLQLGDQTLESTGDQRDIFLAKYAPQGNLLWAQSFGNQGADYGRGVGTDANGNLYFTGVFTGTVSFGEQTLVGSTDSQDIFLGKANPQGQILWVRQLGGPGLDEGAEIEVDAAGEIYLAGSFARQINLESTVLDSAGARDIFAAQYGPEGDLRWVTQAGGLDDDVHYAIALSQEAAVALVGTYLNGIQFGDQSLPDADQVDSFVTYLSPTGANPPYRAKSGHEDERTK